MLSESSVCESCGARATQVDHIIPQSRGGTHARANLRPLCARCHAIKTNTIDRPLARRGRQVAK